MIISKALIGCRVYRCNDESKKIIGKIVGYYVTDKLFFTILRTDGEFDLYSPSDIGIVKEDFDKIYNKLQPVTQKQHASIEDRFEIMDL